MANIIKLETIDDYKELVRDQHERIMSLQKIIEEQTDLKLSLHKSMRKILDSMLLDD